MSKVRQSQCNWGKSTQTLFSISIKPYFRLRKSYPKSSQNNKEKMVRPWVKVSLHQYQKLNELKEETDRPLSEIIRGSVCRFVRKKDFPVSATVSYLPKGTKDKYKSVSGYFARSDWNLLAEISKNTRRPKTELVREAVDEYLTKWVWWISLDWAAHFLVYHWTTRYIHSPGDWLMKCFMEASSHISALVNLGLEGSGDRFVSLTTLVPLPLEVHRLG